MWTLTGFLLTLAGFAQTAQFEVASIKPHVPGDLGLSKITTDPGRLRAEYVDSKQLIGYAYDVSPLVIAGEVPGTRFDVEAKAEGANTRAELRLMLQSLLANRFGLRLHRETSELSVDALVVGKSPKLQASDVTDPDPRGFVLHAGKLPHHVAVEGHAISLPGLANYLSTHHRGRLIVDATGLKGVYDFSVDYEIDTEKVLDANVPVSEASASLMEDLAKALGLKIESGRRLPVEMLVIDQISPPDPN
ncbi:MAG TPA: TIGR03435 family protein [Bryobacteraceae bacterium]